MNQMHDSTKGFAQVVCTLVVTYVARHPKTARLMSTKLFSSESSKYIVCYFPVKIWFSENRSTFHNIPAKFQQDWIPQSIKNLAFSRESLL